MRYEESKLYIVNDANTYTVDRNGNDRLLWCLDDDTMGIGRDLKGESEDGTGYIDMVFGKLEIFKSKREAMEEWVSA